MDTLARRWEGKAQFVFVYGKEPHPHWTDHLIPYLDQTGDQAERATRARAFCDAMGGSVRRFLVDEDGPDHLGAVQSLYGGQQRVVVVDTQGQIVFSKAGEVVPEVETCLQGMIPAPSRLGDPLALPPWGRAVAWRPPVMNSATPQRLAN